MRTRVDVRALQKRTGEAADELAGIRHRLLDIVSGLPEPAVDVLENEAPADVETELLGAVECVVNDDIDPAIRKLRAASQVTAEQLRADWERSKAGGGSSAPV